MEAKVGNVLQDQTSYTIILPEKMLEQRFKLQEMLRRYPVYLPLSVVAKFLNMKQEGLRACIKQGRCPFGLGYEVDDKSAFKIPTETFYLWYTHAVIRTGI